MLRLVGAVLVTISHPIWCVPLGVCGVQIVPNYPTPLMEGVENPPALHGLFPFAHLTAPPLHSAQLHGASLCNMFSFLFMNSCGQRKPGENFHSFLPHSILLSCTRPYKGHTPSVLESPPRLPQLSEAAMLTTGLPFPPPQLRMILPAQSRLASFVSLLKEHSFVLPVICSLKITIVVFCAQYL